MVFTTFSKGALFYAYLFLTMPSRLRHTIIVFTILSLNPNISRAQGITQESDPGLYFTQNFTPEEYHAHAQNWAVKQDDRGIIYIGNGNGILEYDGATWRLIPMPNKSVVRSIDIDQEGTIYVGAHAELGYLSPDSIGVLHYFSLLDHIDNENRDFNNVWKVHSTPRGTYFRTETHLFLWSDNRMKVWKPEDAFHKSFFMENEFYIREWASGLLRMNEDSLVVVPGGEEFINTRIDAMLSLGDDRILIGSRTTGLYIYDGNTITQFATEADHYLKENQVYDGVRLPNGQIALATLRGGVVVIDSKGRFLRVINTESGIMDNTVWSLALDKQGALWLALNEGLARIELQSPLSFFSDELGLESSVESIKRYRGTLYAATGLGLFFLYSPGSFGEPSFFKPVPGIEGQAWSLVTTDKALLTGTSQGIYLIQDEQTNQLNDDVTFFLHRSLHEPRQIFAGLGDGLGILEYDGDGWIFKGRIPGITEEIRSISEGISGDLWLGTAFHGVLRVHFENRTAGLFENVQVERFGESDGLPLGEIYVSSIEDEIFFGTERGLRYFDTVRSKFMPVIKRGIELEDSTRAILRIARQEDNGFWLSGLAVNPEIKYLNDRGDGLYQGSPTPLNRISSLGPVWSIYPDEIHPDLVWLGTNSGVVRYDQSVPFHSESFSTLIRKVVVKGDSVIYGGDLTAGISGNPASVSHALPYQKSSIRFEFTSLSFDDPASNRFQYMLEGFDDKWSVWTDENIKEYTHLPAGNYLFKVRSQDIYQHPGEDDKFSFSVLAPWYWSWWSLLLYVLFATISIYGLILWRTRSLKKDKEMLESQVKERTRQIEDQKVEIEAQRDEVIHQKDQLESQRDLLVAQKKEITDSINYAQRIQHAVLPSKKYLEEAMPEYFVLFKPRDIVSGDFYWIRVFNKYLIVVAADSTGHGVPGAFMSMLGVALLNEQVGKGQNFQPGEILEKLREEIKEILVQKGNIREQKDGMDMAIAIIDYENKELRYAGANNPLYLVRSTKTPQTDPLDQFFALDNEDYRLFELKGDKQPIGIYWKETEFNSRKIKLQEGDSLYLFSDGFVDQKGGPNNKKFLSRNFKKLLLEIQNLSMEAQKLRLEETFESWKQDNEQVDDILIIGIRWKPEIQSTFMQQYI